MVGALIGIFVSLGCTVRASLYSGVITERIDSLLSLCHCFQVGSQSAVCSLRRLWIELNIAERLQGREAYISESRAVALDISHRRGARI
mgnify:CR=1 FL=1